MLIVKVVWKSLKKVLFKKVLLKKALLWKKVLLKKELWLVKVIRKMNHQMWHLKSVNSAGDGVKDLKNLS